MRVRWVVVAVLFALPLRVEGASMIVDASIGLVGDEVQLAVRLATDGDDVSGAFTELGFDPALPIAPARSGDPDCAATLGDVTGGFSYQPGSCTPGVDCERVRGVILSFGGTLPDGVLFRCRVEIPAATPTDTAFPVELVAGVVSDPSGTEVDVTDESSDGSVFVVGEPLCLGDCDGDGRVSVSELVAGVDRALSRNPSLCLYSDRDADGTVDLTELIGAVSNSIESCPTQQRRAPGREVESLPSAQAGDLP